MRVDGSTSAAIPLLAAAATLNRVVELTNVPASGRVNAMRELLYRCQFPYADARMMTSSVSVRIGADTLNCRDAVVPDAGRDSLYLLPALLAARGGVDRPWPTSRQAEADIGLHLIVYEAFGDDVGTDAEGFRITAASPTAQPVVVHLPYPSREASIVAVLRAVATRRPLRLHHPDHGVELNELLSALRLAGFRITLGTSLLAMNPPQKDATEGLVWPLPGDAIEAGILACAVAVTGGAARIEGVRGQDVSALAHALNRGGIHTATSADAITVRGADLDTAVPLSVVTGLARGDLDTDHEPALLAAALTTIPGTHTFTDGITPHRHAALITQLARLGARISASVPPQCRVVGGQDLIGATVECTESRAGTALLVAALAAQGETTLTGLAHIEHAHIWFTAKLRTLGANIEEIA
ncbi:UDP-N-acetylglucosamine 1-carboxyvinyltransferase [Streptomyces sp. NPDC088925]|uniref:UDP-N-acetylglucosamine 1-carboxyvinyltransferase n=1 Tax=Streptomyces sp. NPDC088925 TaxID=3365914 RepID=UPI003809BF93